MAKSPEQVLTFLRELALKSKPVAEQDFPRATIVCLSTPGCEDPDGLGHQLLR